MLSTYNFLHKAVEISTRRDVVCYEEWRVEYSLLPRTWNVREWYTVTILSTGGASKDTDGLILTVLVGELLVRLHDGTSIHHASALI